MKDLLWLCEPPKSIASELDLNNFKKLLISAFDTSLLKLSIANEVMRNPIIKDPIDYAIKLTIKPLQPLDDPNDNVFFISFGDDSSPGNLNKKDNYIGAGQVSENLGFIPLLCMQFVNSVSKNMYDITGFETKPIFQFCDESGEEVLIDNTRSSYTKIASIFNFDQHDLLKAAEKLNIISFGLSLKNIDTDSEDFYF